MNAAGAIGAALRGLSADIAGEVSVQAPALVVEAIKAGARADARAEIRTRLESLAAEAELRWVSTDNAEQKAAWAVRSDTYRLMLVEVSDE